MNSLFSKLINKLKEISEEEIMSIHEFKIKKVNYFEWNQFDGHENWSHCDSFNGIGGKESHFLIKFNIEPILNLENQDNSEHIMRIVTGDNDIWNNNNPQLILFINKVSTATSFVQ